MFRLDKLEINGFKSFADRTTLLFGEGITGVVGPNGCGKSNVAEAISWVLGEQSAKNLRGGKMEDVIFNGTRDRKPTGMAEVLLTMVATEDIAAREVEKDDESEYEDAINSAEHAAEAARSLVQEMTRAEASEAPPGSALASQAGATEQPTAAEPLDKTEEGSQANQLAQVDTAQVDTEALPSALDAGQSASVKGEHTTSHFELPSDPTAEQANAQEAEGENSQDQKKAADAARAFRRRKRRAVAVSAGERITVGRRLYRTGDSEYLMNGRPCLLRDIQDLFAGTGLGGAHYAIVEQGRIGQILSSKPLDRRGLIEEAAGITKFKSRKRSAELKLESAKLNLTRLNDIISEVERQVNSLKRQAQKARRYRRLREEMRSLLKIVFTADYHRLNEAIDRVACELEGAESARGELDALLYERETEHRAASSEARSIEDALRELREKAAAVELEADRARNRRAFEEQQIQELAARIEELNRDQQALESRLALLDENSQQRSSDLAALETALAGEQSDLLNRESEYHAELAQLRGAENEIEQMRQRMLTEIGVTERLRNLSASLEDALRRLDLKQSNLRAELERASGRHEEASGEYTRVGAEVENDLARLTELTEHIAARAANLITLRNEAASFRSELEEVHAERTSSEHRLTSLEDLDAHHAYYSDAVQQVLSPEQAAKVNALGTLADFVEVEAQYERLIESLFSRELQCMLVPTIDDALAGVDYIKSEGLGRGAFLVVGLHGGEEEYEDGGRGPGAGGRGEENKDAQQSGIERWLIDSAASYEVSRIDEDYIPIERQLPPADFAFTEPFPSFPEAGYQLPVSDASHEAEEFGTGLESGEHVDHRAVDRRFDEEANREASRFQLDVLRAIDLLRIRPEIKTVVERAFPDRCAASVVPDIEAALQLSIENASRIYVTYEGEQVVNGRLIVTGAQAGQKGTSLLGLKREIKQLRVQTETLRDEEQRIAFDLSAVEREREGLEGEAAALDRELRQHEKAAAARDSQLQGLQRDLERAAQHVRVVEAELEQSTDERRELESRIEQLFAEVQTAEASREAVQLSLAAAQAAFVEMRARVEQLSEQVSTVRASTAARAERLHAAKAEVRRIESEAEELRSRINRNRLELYESHSRVEQITLSHAEGNSATGRFEATAAALAERINEASGSLASSRARTDELEAELTDLRQQAAALRDRRGNLEVERARIESEAEHLTRICFSELAMSLEDVVASVELNQASGQLAVSQFADGFSDSTAHAEEFDNADAQPVAASEGNDQETEASREQKMPDAYSLLPADIDAARARLDELRVKLDDMGPVNMMALEELEESEERFKFLTEQRRDILDSIMMTEEALAEIKRRTRERFRDAFTNINRNFQHMFVELFGGGRGEMILIDEEDILESGIDLIAQPPGKRLQNVLLLSGGEKAMAAIALVLAIFQYRPSPFCILDEVDAPLDEMNVGRFSNKVVEMSRDTQFLVITHNKRTMESARALYGVTMQEQGVSKLVSVKFE
jgi:chromosome segregation protein